MLNIYLSDINAGTSERLCAMMVKESLVHPEDSFIFIVPEQSTQQMQRMTVSLHPFHVVMNIDITSFDRLALKVFNEHSAQSCNILDETGKVLILRKILNACRNDLSVYGKKALMPGFASRVKSVLSELAQYDVDDNGLFLMQESARKRKDPLLYAKLQDIRLIRQEFYREMGDAYQTSQDLMSAFSKLIKDSAMIRGSHIYLDGFTGFTPVQYRLIEELLKYCPDVNIALVLPADYEASENIPLNMFALINKTCFKLGEAAAKAGQDVAKRRFDGNKAAISDRTVENFVYAAPDYLREVEFIAGHILDGVRRKGLRFRDFGVILSDTKGYYRLVKDVFEAARIPCFIDYKTSLKDNILARTVISAMNAADGRFSHESVFSFLKCGMTDISGDDLNKLENYCLEFGIKGFSAWEHRFEKNRRLYKEGSFFWDLDELNAHRKKVLYALGDFYRDCAGKNRPARVYCAALKALMEKNRISEKLQAFSESFREKEDLSRAKQYEQVYELIESVLDQIQVLMPDDSLSQGDFADMLEGAFTELKVGIIPPSLDAVTVGDLTRTRMDNVKVLFMAGLNDTKMPAVKDSPGLLTDRERQLLYEERFELAPLTLEELYTQHFYIYSMMARPEQKLYLSYSLNDMQGGELRASYILSDLEEFGISKIIKADSPGNEMLWDLDASLMLAQQMRKYVVKCRETQEGQLYPEFVSEDLLEFFAKHDPERLSQMIRGAFYETGSLRLDENTALKLYGEKVSGSVSRYEKFYECPFKHFMNYGLRLKERPEYQVRSADIGTLYHDSLDRYSKALVQQGLSFRDVSDEKSAQLVLECVENSVKELESDAIISTKRSEYLLNAMTRVLAKTTDVLRMHVKQGLYEPQQFEMSFSEEGTQMDFRGKIDRVDIYDAGDIFVKIIDYKSGNKAFSIRDIYTGQQLQLAAYLNAAISEVRKISPDKNVRPGGVYYYLIQDKFVKTEKENREKFRMSGLTNNDPLALAALDRDLAQARPSTVAKISFTRNGLSASSSVADDTQFENLMTFVQGRIYEAGNRIQSGDVSIAPYFEDQNHNACTYCEYRDVCKFEPGRWGCDYRTVPENMGADDIEREVYGTHKLDAFTAAGD